MIRFAILGPGHISHRFLAGLNDIDDAKVTAFATRHPEQIQEYAKEAGISRILSYDELYASDDIDAVYISTPPFVHAEQIRNCLLSGKHVLVEKPMGITPEEADSLYHLAESQRLTLMEAQKALFLPVYDQITRWLHSGRLGRAIAADASFSRRASYSSEHWVMSQPGRGCVYDVGVYPLAVLLSLFGIPDKIVRLDSEEEGCPISSVISMHANGIEMTAFSGFACTRDNKLKIYGENGHIECEDFWHAHDADLFTEEGSEHFHSDFNSEFTFETKHFLSLIKEGRSFSPVITPELSMEVLRIAQGKNL
ncbi:MAG: Gfo/Idh/MocA family oxidoreductase [Erysipelotrichia bacterium]|nr:Gfo/Idh/MocA family oxidoreductase [Erysipelotrichia bacterium]